MLTFNNKIQVVFVLFIVVVVGIIVFFPFNNQSELITIILSVATFLFGIFVAFSISDRNKRMEKIRTNDSHERSNLVNIYSLSKTLGKKISERIRKKIDEYLMATLDYKIWDFYKTEKEFNALFDLTMSIKTKNKPQMEEIIERLEDIRLSRGETAEVINERLSKFEWVITVFLCLVALICLILINPGTLISIILLSGLSAAVIFSVYFLYSLDNLSWKEETIIFEPYAQTFESLGLLRYYPEDLITFGKVKKHMGKKYRLGVFPKSYQDFSGKKIKIVKG